MANFYDFSSDNINIFLMNIDSSDSMCDDRENVKKGMFSFKKSFENFPELNSIAVSLCKFSNDFYPGEFKHLKDLKIDYNTHGTTALCYSIVKGGRYLLEYIEDVTNRKGTIPRATYIVFSDGEPCDDPMTEDDAREMIKRLNYSGVTTVFVAFGEAIESEFGARLGFMSTIDVDNRETLSNFLGVELSQSCKEQSMSLKPLGENFFSHAVDTDDSEGYSQTTAQALEDDSWINDI